MLWTIGCLELAFLADNALTSGSVGDVVLYALTCSLGFGLLGWGLTVRLKDGRSLIPAWSWLLLLFMVTLRAAAAAILATANDAAQGGHLGIATLSHLRAWVPELFLPVTAAIILLAVVQRIAKSRARLFGYAAVLLGVLPHLAAAYLILKAHS